MDWTVDEDTARALLQQFATWLRYSFVDDTVNRFLTQRVLDDSQQPRILTGGA